MAKKTDIRIVTTRDGARGKVTQHIEGDDRVLVQFEDGPSLLVPMDTLVLQEDGTYHLPVLFNDIKNDSSASVAANEKIVVPVIEEQARIDVREVTSEIVRVKKLVNEHEETVSVPLLKEEIDVERVAVNRVITDPVEVRQDGDTLIIPVMEEVLVIEKRLVLKEELRVTRRRGTKDKEYKVNLRSEEVVVDRINPAKEARDQESRTR
jgi:uncharacterized protein (TIGR02271 family)